MTPEERISSVLYHSGFARRYGALNEELYTDIRWLCEYTKDAKRAGAEDALRWMRDWCAKQEESATEEMELADSRGWYEAEGEFEDFRKTYQKVLGHIEQRLAALKEDKTDA